MIQKNLTITYILLILLTITIATLAYTKSFVALIIALGIIKFWLVAFVFMDLKSAHNFWKVIIVIFGTIFGIVIIGLS